MGNPVLLVDTFFSPRQYALHTLSASENSADAVLVGAARRSTFDAWSAVTANLDAWLKTRNDVLRAADMIAVDRGHNQGGKTVKVQCSDDDFTTTQDIFNSVTPSATATGDVDDALGVRTWEGAWLKRFPVRGAHDWRYFIPALGSGIKATVTGLWIGLSWSPGYVSRPFAPQVTELVVEETQSDLGWLGRGKGTPRRQGVLHFNFGTVFDAEVASYHIGLYAQGRPMWIVPDEERADQAFVAVLPRGTVGLVLEPHWFYPRLDLPYQELDPLET